MVKVEVNVPEIIGEFYYEDRDIVVIEALRHVVFGAIKKKTDKLKEADIQIKYFEKKYHQGFEDFQKNMPLNDEIELHENWVEWSYWVEVQKRLKNTIGKMSFLYGENL
ncbi:hypothetical protein AUJ95_08850 [Candidatus Desantisbacteria bacterium CG2_30_40_21]|uniref:Uncharacterized protein n=5 Tax=unclassified Candidatus Desantisiibacteriota TaxID=3106372 RepID=A0A2M7J9F3_9BACT|nr:MAG: hypothetical protein AUJ95_08850 [Candidatus Desantisbacteria bacterium CG2_30_40_21]PIP42018.1 MAG: hypothetical protein COX18_01710 [Candidatus Desantisbacteria bacterium CG23_combo_of_CG06-09_8_20_14_all_40_23]PIX16046.1 MAG: hypothetical protein COZ71_08715 [Candidatus Desantisbacteria bacterium CG_4_8_14_3_um_filter_40_12]PIY19755.1 MAG: hypothetical protein COZ13_03655 [Candidatus Desantisbacteria bacterium CG_4_10_14_3_um_filter_40_18]PJB29883.1 MAG: hypothetical protein CO110_03